MYHKVPHHSLQEVTPFRLNGPAPLIGFGHLWMNPFLLNFLHHIVQLLLLLLLPSFFLAYPRNLSTTTLTFSLVLLRTHAFYK